MNIENINSKEKIYSKEKKSNRLYFFKKLEKKKLRKEVGHFKVSRRNFKIQNKLIMWARKKQSKIQIQKKIYIQKKKKSNRLYFFKKLEKKN